MRRRSSPPSLAGIRAALPQLQRAFDWAPRERSGVSQPAALFAGPMAEARMADTSGTGDGTYTFTGRAVVYDQRTTLYDGELFGGRTIIRETVAPGALTDVLASGPTVHLNHGHDMKTAMARATSFGEHGLVNRGGMKLWETEAGLDVFARLNPEDPDVHRLHVKMADGIVDQMSFAFWIGEERVEVEYEENIDLLVVDYTVEKISGLFDVCACAQGAYPTTSADLRELTLDGSGHDDSDSSGPSDRHANAGEPNDVTPPPAGDSTDPARARRLAALKARARVAAVTHSTPGGEQ